MKIGPGLLEKTILMEKTIFLLRHRTQLDCIARFHSPPRKLDIKLTQGCKISFYDDIYIY